ncbi:MAG: hypothetical protein RIG84_02230 [Roseovarius sp.]
MSRCAARLPAALFALCVAAPALAQTDLRNMTPEERAIFGNEIREALLGVPELLPRHLARRAPEAAELYADEIENDLARIAAQEAALFGAGLPGFGPEGAAQRIALVTTPDCAACAEAEAELRSLARRFDLRVTLVTLTPGLAESLDLDTAPSYVMPDRMLRGHIPPIVLERYLSE